MIHSVTLSNGKVLLIEEDDYGRLSIASAAAADDEPDAYLCQITVDGVLVYSNSGDACSVLLEHLPRLYRG